MVPATHDWARYGAGLAVQAASSASSAGSGGQFGVAALSGQQAGVGARFDDVTVVENDDLVRVADGGQPVRDGDRGPALGKGVERLLHGPFGLGVEGAGRLVQDQDARVPEQGPGDRDPLLLAAGEPVPAGADHGVVPVGQADDEVVNLGRAGRVFDLLVGGGGPGVAQVFPHRGVQQVGLLADHADDGGQVGQPQVAQVDAVDGDRSAAGVVQPGHQGPEGGLTGAGLADQSQRRARGDVQIDVAQRGTVGAGVGEADVGEADVPGDLGRVDADRMGGLVDLDRQVQVLEDPREQGQRADHRHARVEQPGDRPEQGVLQCGEGDQRADADHAGGG